MTNSSIELEERQIFEYLKAHPKEYLTVKEISRFVASPHLYSKGPLWAAPYLKNLHHKGLIAVNAMNHYRFMQSASKKKISVSPQIAAILKGSGKNFSQTVILEETDESLESFLKKSSSKPRLE